MVVHSLSAASLFDGNGHQIIRELLRSDDFAGVSIEKQGGMYLVEGRTKPEYQQIMRKYISAFPGSLSKELERKVDDLVLVKKWLGEGFTLLLIPHQDFVRAYRYQDV